MTELASGQPHTSVIECPLRCGWSHTAREVDPRIGPGTLADVFGPNVFLAHAQNTSLAQIEHEIRAHLETHRLVEWVAAVTDLRAARDVASAAAENFRERLHWALDLDPTPCTVAAFASCRLDDETLIARILAAITSPGEG